MNTTPFKQQSAQANKIPAQPLIRTIGKGDMPKVSFPNPPAHRPGSEAMTHPIGWNGTCWHDGAD